MAVESVDAIVARWQEIRPELDPTPMRVLGRLGRLADLIEARLRPPFAAVRLANGDFDLLAALRRQGPPHEANAGDLASAMLVTTGATTKRIDRLEARGYVARRTADGDRRVRMVALTTAGRRLTDRLIATHLGNEARLLAGLSERQRGQLVDLLDVLAASVAAADE